MLLWNTSYGLSMAGVVGISVLVGAPQRVIIIQAVILPITCLFIITRPNGPIS